jgi:hypothetical protein
VHPFFRAAEVPGGKLFAIAASFFLPRARELQNSSCHG